MRRRTGHPSAPSGARADPRCGRPMDRPHGGVLQSYVLRGAPSTMQRRSTSESSRVEVEVPYGAWFEETSLRLAFPPGWEVRRADPDDAPEIDDAAVEAALAAPVGAPPLLERARGRRRAVIAVDDLTRPTPAHRLLPPVLRILGEAGLPAEAITILLGTASHRPPTRDEQVRKLGAEVVARHPVVVHDFLGRDVRRVGW